MQPEIVSCASANQPRTPQKLPPRLQLIKKGKVKKQKRALKANFEVCLSPCCLLYLNRATDLM